ncbi:MAG: NAD(P)/FAD-dependent oxidoreductase [Anaerovoracaceae bacterium]
MRGFFYSLGVLTREEAEGRVYPVSGSAADVVRALECALEAAGVEVRCEQPVTEVRREEDGTFSLRCGSGVVHARRLVLACGGKAGPQYGCSGDGYRFARHLGHSTTRLYPVLTGIECELDPGVRGVRCDGTVQLLCRGALAAEESGQIQVRGRRAVGHLRDESQPLSAPRRRSSLCGLHAAADSPPRRSDAPARGAAPPARSDRCRSAALDRAVGAGRTGCCSWPACRAICRSTPSTIAGCGARQHC